MNQELFPPLNLGYDVEVKASELVTRLQELIAAYGDQKVNICYDKSYNELLTFGNEDEIIILE